MYNIEYLYDWLKKMEKNEINKEILFLVFKNNMHRKKAFNDISKYFDEEKYNLFDIDELKSINDLSELSKKENIILLGHNNMNIEKINNLELTLLLYRFNTLFLDFFIPIIKLREGNKNSEKIFLFDDEYKYYIKKQNIIEIIFTCKKLEINEYIHQLFHTKDTKIFRDSLYTLRSNRLIDVNLFHVNIEKDLQLLYDEKILTSRLSIILYKISTFRFHDSNTKIGNFYRKQLNIKSKETHIKKIKPYQSVRAYHLKNSEITKELFWDNL